MGESRRFRCGWGWTQTLIPLLVLATLSACDRDVVETQPQLRRMDSIQTGRGLVGRSVISCPAGECIILHYPLRPLTEEQRSDYVNTRTMREGRLAETVSPLWSPASSFGSVNGTFNCCTYAVGDVLGLSSSDWLAPNASGDTEDTVPMQIVLDSYYSVVRSYPGPKIDWESIQEDGDLRDDDVLCFVNTSAAKDEYAHVGRIRKRDSANWLVSKLGVGPIVESPIEATGSDFAGQFNDVRIYRRNSG